MKLKSLTLAALFLLAVALPLEGRADGLLQKGDTSHPLPAFQVQTSTGSLVNGDTLVMHFLQGGTATTGTGTFAQPDTANQPGAEVYTFSTADMSGLAYGYVLCQPVDTTTPGNIINPYLVNLVALNAYDAAALGLSGISTAATQATSAATGTANNGLILALLKSGQILGTGTVTAATTPTATAFSTTLTATPDLISGDGLIFTSGVNAGKNIHILTNTAGLFGLPGTGLPAAPSAGDTFVLIPFSKALTTFTASLGTDSRPLLSSSDTQAGAETASTLTTYGAAKTADVTAVPGSVWTSGTRTVTGGAVTSVTGSVGSVTAPVSLAQADETKIGIIGADTPGITSLLGRPAQTGDTFGLLSPLIASNKFTAPALSLAPTGSGGSSAPSDYLSAAEKAQLALASTAQQAGQPVTLPSTVLSQADILAVQQAIMTYALHTGVSYQKAVAQIYLNTAGAVTPTKSGTVQTNPFVWPDGTTGLTSTLDSSTGKRTETGGTLPN